MPEEALCIEFANTGIPYEKQKSIPIHYFKHYVSTFVADIIVDNTIILELKSVRLLNPVMYSQLINYLKISGLPVGYLINFHNTRVEWRRFVNAGKRGP